MRGPWAVSKPTARFYCSVVERRPPCLARSQSQRRASRSASRAATASSAVRSRVSRAGRRCPGARRASPVGRYGIRRREGTGIRRVHACAQPARTPLRRATAIVHPGHTRSRLGRRGGAAVRPACLHVRAPSGCAPPHLALGRPPAHRARLHGGLARHLTPLPPFARNAHIVYSENSRGVLSPQSAHRRRPPRAARGLRSCELQPGGYRA